MKYRYLFPVLSFAAWVLLSSPASACTMCMGSADNPIAPAVNASIGFLLGVLIIVGSLFFRFVLFLARQDGRPLNPEEGLSQPAQASGTPQI